MDSPDGEPQTKRDVQVRLVGDYEDVKAVRDWLDGVTDETGQVELHLTTKIEPRHGSREQSGWSVVYGRARVQEAK